MDAMDCNLIFLRYICNYISETVRKLSSFFGPSTVTTGFLILSMALHQ